MKVLLCASPKGGSGKTTAARNLAACFAGGGTRVATIDLDRQRSLTAWHARRPKEAPEILHAVGDMADPAGLLAAAQSGCDLVIVDLPPGIEAYPSGTKALLDAADLSLIPSRQSLDDILSVVEFGKALTETGHKFRYLLNGVSLRTRALRMATVRLNEFGPVCSMPWPNYESFDLASGAGIGLSECPEGWKGRDEVLAVHAEIKRELGI